MGSLVRVRPIERSFWFMSAAGLAAVGLRGTRGAARALALTLGGAALYRGVRGTFRLTRRTDSPRQPEAAGRVEELELSVEVNRAPLETYRAWHRFPWLPTFMAHLDRVTQEEDPSITTWVLRTPLHTAIRWHARTLDDVPGRLIRWESIPDSDVANEGYVRFSPAPGGRGTEVRVRIGYVPPGGKIGKAILSLLGQEPRQLLQDELARFKDVMETRDAPRKGDSADARM